MKSQPTWGSIANSAGSAYCGGMSPLPIRVPSRTPTTWAMTAPGPSTGDRIGIAQKMLIASRPIRLPASGSIRCARRSPRPVLLMMPIEHGDERHERQDVADHRVDGVAAGLVERADDAADRLADA